MKIIPVAINHCFIELDNGEIIDANDGTAVPKGTLTLRLLEPTKKRLVTATSLEYDASVRLFME